MRYSQESSALAVSSHVRLKAVGLTPQSKPVWTWAYGTVPVVVDNVAAATRQVHVS